MRKTGFVLLLTLAVCFAAPAKDDAVSIEGGLISGTVEDEVRVYKGVPFAAPPVGALRWRDPQPVVPWEGVRECTEFSDQCPQIPYPAMSLYARPPHDQSENCLYLNIWTAAESPDDKKPVMVWIHGGGLTRGSGDNPAYDGAAFAKEGIVLVTINYRVGVFGFLAHPELTRESSHASSGNYGFLDQVEALRWVQKNISAFGGDPDRVTIFGESAGSWSVNVLVASPLAKGLFHGAIGESGASFGPMSYLKTGSESRPSAESVGLAFAKACGAKSIDEFRAVSSERIIEVFEKDPEGKKFSSRGNVDGWMLPDEIRTIYAKGHQNDVPVIVGSNKDEMTSLTIPTMIPRTLAALKNATADRYGDMIGAFNRHYPAKDDKGAAKAYLDSLRDRTFTWGMRSWARMTGTGSSKAYHYFFTHVPPIPNNEYFGAFHASEISYAFGNLDRLGRGTTYGDTDYAVSETVSSYWINFANTGDPNGEGLPTWEPYNEKTEPYMELGDPAVLRNHLLKEQLDFTGEQFVREWAASGG